MPSKYRETVIDGYNLIHKLRDIAPGEPMASMRERLEAMLTRYRQKSRRHVTVVYDGGGGPRAHSSRGSIEVTYSGSLKSADRWIIDHARSLEPRPGMMLVVSSDREIQRHATAWGARCIDSETFIEELAAMGITTNGDGGPSRKAGEQSTSSAPLSDKEVDYWLRMFDRKK
ncbi:conserved hypothetical protein [Chlorobaculum parvum NCIB 8327]|uniref:NYN domain-containing protein n=1 Tax=Chlorobaculum parvum (strain DSM 263 / NCIMB 8327) TaxID=517417 RepID=B3QLX4_CHLP8|nr:NYN domain-containing protein [Chlorobaculum parvum]ACF12460.1 conserved hypothetical protein [Chlorobaculum parvum NCIB 8327]